MFVRYMANSKSEVFELTIKSLIFLLVVQFGPFQLFFNFTNSSSVPHFQEKGSYSDLHFFL